LGIKHAVATRDSRGHPAIDIEFDDAGSQQLTALTEAHIDCALAIVIDGVVLSAPVVKTTISRRVEITGSFDEQEAAELARALKGGMVRMAAGEGVDTLPPVVVETVPAAGDMAVDPSITEIRVTFSKAMTDGSWSWSTASEGSFPQMIGKPRYLADRRTCVLQVKLEPGKTYATWLNSQKFGNFKDTDGRSAVPYLLIFETRP